MGGRGRGGVGGGLPPGQLSPALGWLERTAGKVALGSPPSWRRVHHPQVLQPPSPSPPPPPGSSACRISGPREPDLSLCSLPSQHSPLRVTPVFFGGRPSKGATAFPPRPAPNRVGRGGADCPQCAPGGSRRRARGVASRGEPQERRASARGPRRCRPPTRPVLKHGPRSLTRARVRGSHESRRGAMKVKAALSRRPRWDPEASPSPPRAHHRPVSPAAPGRWSTSARVRTRKMVNYAWAGRSQRKLWWRSVAVLTCKSVVRPGYRGERLIEPSSSWFPPKFPSG